MKSSRKTKHHRGVTKKQAAPGLTAKKSRPRASATNELGAPARARQAKQAPRGPATNPRESSRDLEACQHGSCKKIPRPERRVSPAPVTGFFPISIDTGLVKSHQECWLRSSSRRTPRSSARLGRNRNELEPERRESCSAMPHPRSSANRYMSSRPRAGPNEMLAILERVRRGDRVEPYETERQQKDGRSSRSRSRSRPCMTRAEGSSVPPRSPATSRWRKDDGSATAGQDRSSSKIRPGVIRAPALGRTWMEKSYSGVGGCRSCMASRRIGPSDGCAMNCSDALPVPAAWIGAELWRRRWRGDSSTPLGTAAIGRG